MNIEKISISEITPSDYNPRQSDDVFKNNLTTSLNEFGFVEPIIINSKTNEIIGGHQRYDFLYNEYVLNGSNKQLFILKLGDISWVFPETDLKIKSDEHEKALNLALNNIGAKWDKEKLENIIEDFKLKEFNIELTGFDDVKLKKLDIDLLDYNDDEDDSVGIPKETNEGYGSELSLKFGKHKIPITDEEFKILEDKYEEYLDEFGVSYGFINNILG
nr:ParB N-terminal domain-containing protein [Methanobrevibacter arboriphilus]